MKPLSIPFFEGRQDPKRSIGRLSIYLVLASLFFSFSGSAVAVTKTLPKSAQPQHDVLVLQDWLKKQGKATPVFRAVSKKVIQQLNRRIRELRVTPSFQQKPTFPIWSVLVQTKTPFVQSERLQLAQKGVLFSTSNGKLLATGNFYAVRILRWEGLLALEKHAKTLRVEKQVIQHKADPLFLTGELVQAYPTHRMLHKKLPLTGKGIVIGYLDSGLDVFHPSFFRADGGFFSWIDADGDNKFVPCVDGVDANGNGRLDKGERLCCIQGRIYQYRNYPIDPSVSTGACRAGIDWLYQDNNGNRKRDFGPEKGFKEQDPTYGERLYIIDDVNKNGRLDVGEKIIGLKTSKIRATNIYGEKRFRGKDLILTKAFPGWSGTSRHGTCSAGVLVAGQTGHSKYLGIAPDADLVMSTRRNRIQGKLQWSVTESLLWLKAQKVQLVLHEYAGWTGYALDGSSAYEQLLDKVSREGMTHICPTGNLGGKKKHMQIKVPAKGKVLVPVSMPAESERYKAVEFSILWRGKPKPALSFWLTTPGKKRFSLKVTGKDNKRQVLPTVSMESIWETSSRGTHHINVLLRGNNGKSELPIELGTWTLEIQGDPAHTVEVHAYVSDDVTSWSRGVHFPKYASDRGLAGWPSTADSCISVGAYAGHDDPMYSFGEKREPSGSMRAYSSGGPRIDGAQIMSVAAPDNPVVPLTRIGGPKVSGPGLGQYMVYSGTSGASPHVAGAVALLKQLHPDWTSSQIRKAIRENAHVDADVGKIPNPRWGYGKLRIYRTLFGKDPQKNQAPRIRYSGPKQFFFGQTPTLQVQVLDAEDAPSKLQVRWDLDYDGSWDQTGNKIKLLLHKPQKLHVKVEVRDSGGQKSQLLIGLRIYPCEYAQECGDGFLCVKGRCVKKPEQSELPKATEPRSQESVVDASTPDVAGKDVPDLKMVEQKASFEHTETGDLRSPVDPKQGCQCNGQEEGALSAVYGLLLFFVLFFFRRRGIRF